MAAGDLTLRHLESIRHSAWMVRHYCRGGRQHQTSRMALLRKQAIQKLGLIVRRAFNECNDFEPLLAELVGSLCPRDYEPPF